MSNFPWEAGVLNRGSGFRMVMVEGSGGRLRDPERELSQAGVTSPVGHKVPGLRLLLISRDLGWTIACMMWDSQQTSEWPGWAEPLDRPGVRSQPPAEAQTFGGL